MQRLEQFVRVHRILSITLKNASTLQSSARSVLRVGGRKTPLGFSQPMGKSPQVKQGKVQGVVRRIPGTTKVEYTNKKGRSFAFRIPVTEVTHPPVNSAAFDDGRWRMLDTSYCDTGDLGAVLPSPVEDYLRSLSPRFTQDNQAAEDTMLITVTQEQLSKVALLFQQFCKEYALMDTRGMKSSPIYAELNCGPDYEHYDRKLMRKNYWLSIRQSYEMVKEFIWPSEVLQDGFEVGIPLLSFDEMLDTLIWLEAASTFCVRSWRAYDLAGKQDFSPLVLSREVKIMGRCARNSQYFHSWVKKKFSKSATGIHVVDRLISCVSLCRAHNVDFSDFFVSRIDSSNILGDVFSCLPSSLSLTEALRLIHGIESLTGEAGIYQFSSTTGGENTEREGILDGFAKLCRACADEGTEGMRNVDERELCVLLRFAVRIRQFNKSFFQTTNNGEKKHPFERFEEICLARCRQLLYQLDGDQTTVMTEESESSIPLIQLQKHKEPSPHQTLLHYSVGLQNAQGLRRASVKAKSAVLLELVSQLESERWKEVHPSELAEDLLHHISKLVSHNSKLITLNDVIKVLPILSRLVGTGSVKQSKFDRLFLHLSTAIGVAMQKKVSADEMIQALEGLAACRFVPSTFSQVEMVLSRLCLVNSISLCQLNTALGSMVVLKGADASRALLHAAGSVVQQHIARASGGVLLNEVTNVDDLLEVLRALQHCRYDPLPGLLLQLDATVLAAQRESWGKCTRCRYGILMAYAGAGMTESDISSKLFGTAEAEIRAGEEGLLSSHSDLIIDAVLCMAALGIPPSESVRCHLMQLSLVHRWITLRQAVRVLQGLDVLQCTASLLFKEHERWLLNCLKELANASTVFLPSKELEAISLLCQLTPISDGLRSNAVRLLEMEIVKLEAERARLERGDDDTTVTSSSFEHVFLTRKKKLAEFKDRLKEVSSLLQENSP